MFDPNTYRETSRKAANAAKAGERSLNRWASESTAAIVNDKLTPFAIAQVIYDELKPQTAKGKPAEPKQKDDGSVSVSSLRNADGGEIFRKAFDDVQYIIANRHYAEAEFMAFVTSGGKLRSVKAAMVKAKAAEAKAEAEALPPATSEQEPSETETEAPSLASQVMPLSELIRNYDGELSDGDEIALAHLIESVGILEKRLTQAPVAELEAA